MKGTCIASTPRSSIHPLAVQGILAPECHAQLTDIVRSRLGETHVLLFAEPIFDTDRGVVDWYTPVQGTPVRLADLAPDPQQRARSRFVAMADDIRACVKPLKAVGDSRRSLAGDILELALRYPGEDALYLVGEQPVVTCWGCGPAQAGVEPQDLSRLGLAPVAPAPGAPAPGAPAPPVSTASGGRLLPWFLALALLLGIAGLGYMIHAGKMPELLTGLGFAKPAPEVPIPARQPDDLTAEHKRLDDLRAEIETLRLQLTDRRSQCEPQALNVPPEAPRTGDLSFLEGDWVCDTGLADSNNQPVIVVYSFRRDGTGRIAIRGESGECAAAARTDIDQNGVLNIRTDEQIMCPGGTAYRGQAVTCTGVGGQTRCEGRNIPGTTTWEANFYRK
jgi:hypothetical protein